MHQPLLNNALLYQVFLRELALDIQQDDAERQRLRLIADSP
jgi:hypothetical protein